METKTNSFLQNLSNIAGPMAVQLGAVKSFNGDFLSSAPLAKDQQYLSDCFFALAEIEGLISQLNYAAISIANFRHSPILKKNKISRYDHIIYHIEGHLLRTTSVVDRLLILINYSFELNLQERDCKPYNLLIDKKNKKGKYSSEIDKIPNLFDLLLNLLRYIDNFREDRNTIAHSNRISYRDLRDIEKYHIIIEDPMDFDINRIKFIVKQQTDNKAKEYKETFMNCNQQIVALLKPIYDILEAQFFQRYNQMKEAY